LFTKAQRTELTVRLDARYDLPVKNKAFWVSESERTTKKPHASALRLMDSALMTNVG
jgi:hypothetical protein